MVEGGMGREGGKRRRGRRSHECERRREMGCRRSLKMFSCNVILVFAGGISTIQSDMIRCDLI